MRVIRRDVCLLVFLSVFSLQSRVSGSIGRDKGKTAMDVYVIPAEIDRLPETSGDWSARILSKDEERISFLKKLSETSNKEVNLPEEWRRVEAVEEYRRRLVNIPKKLSRLEDVQDVWNIITKLPPNTAKHRDARVALLGALANMTRVGRSDEITSEAQEIREMLKGKLEGDAKIRASEMNNLVVVDDIYPLLLQFLRSL